jgi:glycosyltransferase involved in cell wall biosynthesis
VRVVHLCSSGRVGGIETSVLAMLESLRAAEPSWHLAAVAPEQGLFLDRVRQLGCEPVALPFPPALARFGEASAARRGVERARAVGAAISYVVTLRRVLKRLDPEIVHAHGIKMQVLSRWAAPRATRVVWHLHDYIAGRESSERALRASARRCAAAIANSRSVGEDFRVRLGKEPRVSVIYNGVDTARFAPEGPVLDLDARAGLPAADHRTVRIGLPATFGRWKGHDVLLRALRRLPSDRAWRGYIIGAAVYQTRDSQWSLEALQGMTRDLGLGDRVGFTGIIDDMPGAMRALDIVVHASRQPEPFGMTIAEAMSCGRASVVALAGGAAEIVRDGIDAVGYAPGDDEALASVLSALLGDSERRRCLGAEARRTAVASFDSKRLGPQLRDVYGTVLSAQS